MSYYAYTDVSHKECFKVLAKNVLTELDRRREYYCPCCNAIFGFRAQSSNNKPPHFYKLPTSQHDINCWMPYIEGISGEVNPENTRGFTLEGFYEGLISSKERELNKNSSENKDDKDKKPINSTMHLNTIRNLYKFCILQDDNYKVADEIKVKDILVSRKTAFYYRRFAFGNKLVEAQYSGYTDKTIFLNYPFGEEQSLFTVVLNFDDDRLFRQIRNKTYRNEKPILVFSKWNYKESNGRIYVRTKIINTHQVVAL